MYIGKRMLTMIIAGILALGCITGCGDSGDTSADDTPQGGTSSQDAKTVTVSIDCKTVLDNMEQLDPAKVEFVPEDGWILEPTEVVIEEGTTVYDVLLTVCKENKIHMEHNTAPIYNSEYIEGIAQLYEFDCGELSGWNFIVGEESASYGSDKVELFGGEEIQWRYTCDLGRDIAAYIEGVEE